MSRSDGVRTTSTATSKGLPTGHAIDHAETAPGQARVDSQHPHAFPQLPRDRIAHAIPLALK